MPEFKISYSTRSHHVEVYRILLTMDGVKAVPWDYTDPTPPRDLDTRVSRDSLFTEPFPRNTPVKRD